MKKLTRRCLLIGAGALGGAVASRAWTEEPAAGGVRLPLAGNALPGGSNAPGTVLNDASLLNPTRVARHLVMHEPPEAAFEDALRRELAEARAAQRPFAVHAARHSMGGQSLAADGTAITLDQAWLEPDTQAGTYRVAAGMRWRDVIARLDRIGFSPKVMQSNNDFAVGSTFCVNAHGWPVPWSAFGSTVRSVRLMRPDGEVVTASRDVNRGEFEMAMGGYGLTGIVTELDVEMVPNRRLVPSFEFVEARVFGNRFAEALEDPSIDMAYGRMDVTLQSFFEDALIIAYRPDDDQSDLPPASTSGFMSRRARDIFRAQLNSDRMKALRWTLETKLAPRIAGGAVTRNSLVNEPVVTLDDRDPTRTDILHEYFVPPARWAEFVDACRAVIPSSYQQLLNVTLRYVDTDAESVLAYATEPMIAAVMLFSQEMTIRGEADMRRMTQGLVEAALEAGGTYYLPYRLHATEAQFERGYPRAGEFATRKREADPDALFSNALWETYFSGQASAQARSVQA